MMPLLVRGGRVVDPSQDMDSVGDLLIIDGRIARVGRGTTADQPCTVLHAEGLVVSPGFVDLHCHLREPGFEDKETIASGTRAAARGGFTTVCCMPNTEPPIDTRGVVEFVDKQAAAEGVVRVLPIGCITRGRRGKELVDIADLADAGVVALSDDGDWVADPHLMRQALQQSRRFGLFLTDHCQDVSLSAGGVMNEGEVSARLGLKGIPAAAEEVAVARDIELAQETGGRLHIAHVSVAGSVDLVRRAKEKGVEVTAEVTPHHLTMTDDMVTACDTNAKMYPPLRTSADVEALSKALDEGVIDAIATDHAPHTAADKLCDFEAAAFGISVFETALGSLLMLVHAGSLRLVTLVSKLTREPAAILRRSDIGTLKPGACADVTIFDPEAEWTVDPTLFASKGRNTPLAGQRLKGKVMATLCGGQVVHRDEVVRLEKIHHQAGARID